jgi:hypothetical protein
MVTTVILIPHYTAEEVQIIVVLAASDDSGSFSLDYFKTLSEEQLHLSEGEGWPCNILSMVKRVADPAAGPNSRLLLGSKWKYYPPTMITITITITIAAAAAGTRARAHI